MVAQYAIIVKDARKQYGNGVPILNGLNLSVPSGSIYSLLGASGCGKTTLLSCVVGVRKLNSGEIRVLGGQPGSEISGIPGPRVGYMPQDISLVGEFSTIGTFYFFGRINGLNNYIIENRYIILKDLLQLPPRDRLVKHMSGGQQRRVSLAAALLHKPELLILDEPTVGLDPVLRDNIWNHLVTITKEEGATVIITTHYIEEAKQSDRIGLMRCGQLLAESSPTEILEQCQTDSLEDAFLNLSKLQAQNLPHGITQAPVSSMPITDVVIDSIHRSYSKQNDIHLQSSSMKRCQALITKNALQFIRHPGGILFSLILPILQVTLFFNSVGLDPKGLAISIVNDEAANCNYGRNRGNITYNEKDLTCNFVDLSCKFIDGINSTNLRRVYYDNVDEAMQEVGKIKSVGIMYFNRNFSYALESNMEDFFDATDQNILASRIQVWFHTPDRQIQLYIQKLLYENFFNIYEQIMKDCGISPKFAHIPLYYEKPIYGTKDQNFVTFVAPPFILSLIFVLATSICSYIIIADRNSGVWDRSLVQGVKTAEILLMHIVSQVAVIVIQVAAALCLCFLHFNVQCKGSMTAVIWLTVLEGICGMSYGLLISVMCKSYTLVNYASVGSFYPLVLLCGLIWPIEGMPKFLRWLSLILPVTLPGMSLRGVLEKGTSVNDPEVYIGFLVLAVWISGFLILCLFQLRTKST